MQIKKKSQQQENNKNKILTRTFIYFPLDRNIYLECQTCGCLQMTVSLSP